MSQRNDYPRFLAWQPGTRSMGTSGNVFEDVPGRCEPFSELENSKILASSSCGLRPIGTGNIAEQ